MKNLNKKIGNRMETMTIRKEGNNMRGFMKANGNKGMRGIVWNRQAGMTCLAALLAAAAVNSVPAYAADQTFTSEGTASVAVTAEVDYTKSADYTVVLPTSVKLAYDADTDDYRGRLEAGVYGSIDRRCAVYTKIVTDSASPVNTDASGNFVEGSTPDGSKDTAGSITRWYKLADAGKTAYLTAVQDTSKGCVMEWVDAAHSGTLADGEVKMAADSASLSNRAIALLSTEPDEAGAYEGRVMVEFGTVKR